MTDRFDVILADLRDLRAEMRANFHSTNKRLDEALSQCADECPQVFASKSDMKSMRGWVKVSCGASLTAVGFLLVTHEQIALVIFAWIRKSLGAG